MIWRGLRFWGSEVSLAHTESECFGGLTFRDTEGSEFPVV